MGSFIKLVHLGDSDFCLMAVFLRKTTFWLNDGFIPFAEILVLGLVVGWGYSVIGYKKNIFNEEYLSSLQPSKPSKYYSNMTSKYDDFLHPKCVSDERYYI